MKNLTPSLSTLAYYLTFNPYGTWLPGDRRGWCRRTNTFARQRASPGLEAHCRARLRYPVVTFSRAQREVVGAAIAEACAFRGWTLHALAAERTHVHVVVAAPTLPEKVLATLKSRATRQLRAHGHLVDHPHPWAEHGSIRWLYEPVEVAQKIRYVLDDHHVGACIRGPAFGDIG